VLAGVCRAMLYARQKSRVPVLGDEIIKRLIDEEYTRSPFYGSRKMVAHLQRCGHSVNRKRVERLMRTLGLAGMAPGPATSQSHPQISTPTPAESAPITVFNLQENIEGTAAPALPVADTLMMIDGVKLEVLADFAAIRKTKRKGPVTAVVIEEICQQARLAGLTLAQALQTCCEPRRRWARFEASWLRAVPAGWASASTAQTASGAATLTTPTPALWQPPESKPAAPEVVAAGRARIAVLRQSIASAGCGASKGWAHAAIEKHQSGQPVRRAVLLDACAALKLDPASLAAARIH